MFSISKNISIGVGSFSFILFAYLYYVKRCYNYLKSYGFDSPPPKFFFGNLLSFVSSNEPNEANQSSNYSKTLYNWTRTYGKIYGYYEGHSPVLVIADPDLVTEIFVNQSKLVSYRRNFPMSKKSNDPNADIFTTNGIRWVRIRYGLEKVILNTKNQSKCLKYADKCFLNTFIKHSMLDKLNEDFNIFDNIRMMMVQTMFSIIFGDDLKQFFRQELRSQNSIKKSHQYRDNERLAVANHVADKFSEAFEEFEKFSLLKFAALMIPELEFVWRICARFKIVFNSHIFRVKYFADPMDWFYINFIEKYLIKYTLENNLDPKYSLAKLNEDQRRSRLQSFNNFKADEKKFSFFNTFLYLTHNRIIKYNPNEINNSNRGNNRMDTIKENSTYSRRGSFSSRNGSLSGSLPKIRSLSSSFQQPTISSKEKKRHYSTDLWSDEEPKSLRRLSRKSSSQIKINETESEDFENWRLTLNEALNNSLLMFFAGYETTSSAISFSIKIISSLPEQRDKLIDEIKEYWKELSVNMNKFSMKKKKTKKSTSSDSLSSSQSDDESETDDDRYDDVFEEDEETQDSNDRWSDFCDTLEKMKYLDMFVREVLRMFPIANSMVSRKCVVDNLTIDNGNYYIPKNMNIVVDVLSIHYDKTIWGPVCYFNLLSFSLFMA